MKYLRILAAYAAQPLAMQREKIEAITAFLVEQSNGVKFSATEIEARTIGKREAAGVAKSDGNVAVLPIYGVLSHRMSGMEDISGGTSYESLSKSLRGLLADEGVKAIVLDIDSPGGVTRGLSEFAAELRSARGIKPIIAQVTGNAASAAYWIAAQADEIVVSPSAEVGSIGVYTSHDDVSEALAKAGIKKTYISAGKFKVEGNQTAPLSDDTRAYIQESVDSEYAKFVADVATGRGRDASSVEAKFGQGRMVMAEDAVKRGMADRIGTLDDTLERFGVSTRPEILRNHVAAKEAQSKASATWLSKVKAGETPTVRETERYFKGLEGFSNSEAERAARAWHKENGSREADTEADARVAAAIKLLSAELAAFTKE